MRSLSSFAAQGEFAVAGSVADIAEVECNPEVFPPGTKVEISDAQLYSRCAGGIEWVVPNEFGAAAGAGPRVESDSRSITVGLDGVGNATVALVAGPHCAVGDTVISGHTEGAVVESFSSSFAVFKAEPTPEGVTVLPASQVEDAGSSSVATILEAEFPLSTEARVRFAAPELYSRCEVGDKVSWVRENKEVVPSAKELVGGTALEPTGTEAVRTDDDGNAFVIAVGNESCQPGKSFFEADLESSPFTTEEPAFTILPPQPTAEPAFTIEKLQEIKGSGAGFTTSPLTGAIGQTVDYEIVVKNTASVAETFSAFTDANCAPGTIAGGPGSSPVTPGESTTYTCDHVLTKVGAYTNEATVTATTVDGTPLTHTSNQVVVEVPPPTPAFTIEKLQEIKGSGAGFTTSPLEGAIGQTVDYEIVVKNTGEAALTFSSFTDPDCDPGTIAGGPGATPVEPGESTTYTCDHVLTKVGAYTNEATVTGTPEGGPPVITHTSNQVVVEVPEVPSKPAFTIVKLQEINSSGLGFTTALLTGAIGQAVNYEIVVKNTGNVALTFSDFTDPNCDPGTIVGGPGSSPVAPLESTTYTCNHVLTAVGSYTNEATVTGTPEGGPPVITHTSNQVVVEVPLPIHHAASFTIEKLQEVKGSGAGFTRLTLTGAIGQTVDYEVVVKNTGSVALTFSGLGDANCDAGTIAGGPGSSPVAPLESTTYTCDHALTTVGSYTNVATVTGTPALEAPITHNTNQVLVEVPPKPAFTIEKLQEIKGSGAGFSSSTLTGTIGQTVDYEIVVENTGSVALTFSGFTDANCDAGTISGGPGSSPVVPGSSTTYTCNRVLTATGSYPNVAKVTGTPEGEAPITNNSNQVVVNVPESPVTPVTPLIQTMPGALSNPPPPTPKNGVLAECVTSAPLQGASGPKRRTFKVQTSSIGIKQITFYLDGRKLETLEQSRARRGKFTVKINPLKLSFGAHKLSAKMLMSNPSCKAPARSSAFVRPYSARVAPRFTG